MGNCAGKELETSERTFKVTNINDNHVLVRKGYIIVTETELVYVDSKSKQEWEWPFKYLRRYGCEGNVFSFEAGRKCTNGEGTYAFVCNKANDLFTIVAKNIAQGNVQPDVDTNGTLNDNPFRRPLEEPLPPPPPPPSSDTPITDPPLPTTTSPPLPTTGPTPKNYTHLVFTNESTEHIHSQANNEHTPYSQIAFDKTEELSRQSKKKVSLSDIKLIDGPSRRHTEGSTSSSGGRKRKKHRDHRSSSLSSNSSAIDTPNPSTVPHPSISESIPETKSTTDESSYQNIPLQEKQPTEPDQPNYSNIDISTGEIITQSQQQLPEYSNVNIEEEQPNYLNLLLPGQGISSTPVATPTQKRQPDYFNFTPGSDTTTPTLGEQPNYTNIVTDPVGGASLIEDSPNYHNINISNGGGELPQRSHTFNHSDSRSQPGSRSTSTLPAATRGTYAVLNLPSSQYAQLDIKGASDSTEGSTISTARDRSVSAVTSSVSRLTEDPHTDYTVLNFQAMGVISSMRSEREEEAHKEKVKETAKQQQQDKVNNKRTGKGHKK